LELDSELGDIDNGPLWAFEREEDPDGARRESEHWAGMLTTAKDCITDTVS
jgi:hypothetical protein